MCECGHLKIWKFGDLTRHTLKLNLHNVETHRAGPMTKKKEEGRMLATPAKVTWLSLDLARAGISATKVPLVFNQATNCSTSVSEEDMILVMILVFYDVEKVPEEGN